MPNLEDTSHGVNNNSCFFISISVMESLNRKDYKSFKPVQITGSDVKTIITKRVWSPIVYKEQKRSKENFSSSQIIALDCDNGAIPLSEMIEKIEAWGAWAVIGTTKSHGIAKLSGNSLSPPCDRFRVFFKMSEALTDRQRYEYNFMRWTHALKADTAVKDAARYFFPCKEIVFEQFGEPMDFLELPKGFIREEQRQKWALRTIQTCRDEKKIPMWIIRAVYDGHPGGRHNISYAIGATMCQLGYQEDEVTDYIMRGPISEIGRDDVARAVGNGFRKILGENGKNTGSGKKDAVISEGGIPQ